MLKFVLQEDGAHLFVQQTPRSDEVHIGLMLSKSDSSKLAKQRSKQASIDHHWRPGSAQQLLQAIFQDCKKLFQKMEHDVAEQRQLISIYDEYCKHLVVPQSEASVVVLPKRRSALSLPAVLPARRAVRKRIRVELKAGHAVSDSAAKFGFFDNGSLRSFLESQKRTKTLEALLSCWGKFKLPWILCELEEDNTIHLFSAAKYSGVFTATDFIVERPNLPVLLELSTTDLIAQKADSKRKLSPQIIKALASNPDSKASSRIFNSFIPKNKLLGSQC